MASRLMHPLRSINHEAVSYEGSFAPAGTGAPTSLKGKGWTVVRTSQGLFTVTFADVYADMTAVSLGMQLAAAADRFAQVGSFSQANKTLEIRVVDETGAVQDIAANANNRINFHVTFRNSSIP